MKDQRLNEATVDETPLAMERATIAAFKAKSDQEFTRYFAESYIGVADDGFKIREKEVAGMQKLDLQEILVEEAALHTESMSPQSGRGWSAALASNVCADGGEPL